MIALPLAVALFLGAPEPRQFPDEVARALERAVAEARSVGPSAGLAVAVAHGDQLWLHAVGAASLDPYRPATPDTTFRVGSVTKTFTAAAAMRLWEQGMLDLDADVRGYVKEFPPKTGVVTPRLLLSHTSGVGHYLSPRDGRTLRPYSTDQSLTLFMDRPLRSTPGASFLYSSYGYVLLGVLVERAAGEPFADHLERTLLGPLKLDRTGLEASPKVAADRATGYRLVKGQLLPALPLDISSRFSSGGFRSTAHDVIRWGQALLHGEVVRSGTFRLMTEPAVTTEGLSADYGLGFAVYPLRGRKVVAHAGGQPGASALLFTVPEEDFAVALLSNLGGEAPQLTTLATALMEIVLDEGACRRGVYTDALADEVRFDAFARIMSYGLVAAREGGLDGATDRGPAFARLEELLDSVELNPAATLAQIRRSYHPRTGRISVVVGAEMARVLAEAHGPQAFSTYPRRSGLDFFADYVAVCEQRGCPHPFSPSLAAQVKGLAAEWEAIPSALRSMRPDVLAERGDVAQLLAPLEGRAVHPSYVDDLGRQAVRLRAQGREPEATALVELAVRLHPASALAHLALAEDAALRGDHPAAQAELAVAFGLERSIRELTAEALRQRNESMRFGLKPVSVARLDALYAEARILARRPSLVARKPGEEELPALGPVPGAMPYDLSAPMPNRVRLSR